MYRLLLVVYKIYHSIVETLSSSLMLLNIVVYTDSQDI